MSDEKIIGIHTRQPYRPPEPTTITEEPATRIDSAGIEMVEHLLKRLKSGEAYGVVILAGVPDKTGDVCWAGSMFSDGVWDATQCFVGGCHQAAYDIMRLEEADLLSELDT